METKTKQFKCPFFRLIMHPSIPATNPPPLALRRPPGLYLNPNVPSLSFLLAYVNKTKFKSRFIRLFSYGGAGDPDKRRQAFCMGTPADGRTRSLSFLVSSSATG